MAKTIKDLALEVYPVKMVKTYGYLPGGDLTEKDENLPMRVAMEKGANAVLDELKTRLKEYKTNSLGEYFVAWDYLNEVIEELKGGK